MSERDFYTLNIDSGFHNLFFPLSQKEYLMLEESILKYGCTQPITTWDDIILDGYDRYRICTEHHIPFAITKRYFQKREDAIVWICRQQLKRNDLTYEARKYLIGSHYEAELVANAAAILHGPHGSIHRGAGSTFDVPYIIENSDDSQASISMHAIARQIGAEHHVAWNTVHKYRLYTKALEEIREKVPSVVPLILTGQYKISHKNAIRLASLNPEQIEKVINRLDQQESFVRYKKSRLEIQGFLSEIGYTPRESKVSVKDMPPFDPDAEITALTLTIPSWIGSIERIHKSIDLRTITRQANNRLTNVLHELQKNISQLLDILKEVD